MDIKTIPGKVKTFLKEVKIETKRVNWPTRQETLRYTLVVVAVCLLVAVFLGVIDLGFTTLLKKIIR